MLLPTFVSHLSFQLPILASIFSKVFCYTFPNFELFSKSIPRYLHGKRPFLYSIIWKFWFFIFSSLLRKNISEFCILALSDLKKVFKVNCDASGSKVRVILSGESRVIAIFSEKLYVFFCYYSTLRNWRHYCYLMMMASSNDDDFL